MSLAGRVALVTGSATGIGRACALKLAAAGADVVVNYSKSEQEAARTAADVAASGVRALLHQCDVSDEAAVRQMIERTVGELGGLDILVNNAGYTRFINHADFDSLTEEVWDRTLAVNLKGTWFCSKHAAPHLRRHGAGSIVNVASIAGMGTVGSSIAYCASKAAIINLTINLARVLAPDVRVNAVAPGVVDTRWIEGQREFHRRNIATTPMRRMATPDDVAEVVLALVTSCGFVTGQTIPVDGGRMIMF